MFLQKSEIIYKVSWSLLGSLKLLILQHKTLETIVDYKTHTTQPGLGANGKGR